MTIDWKRYETDIRELYFAKNETLDDVRRIMKGRHGFEASKRAWRTKLKDWGLKKNRAPGSMRNSSPSVRNAKTTTTVAHLRFGNSPQYDATNVLSTRGPPSHSWPGIGIPAVSLPTPSYTDGIGTNSYTSSPGTIWSPAHRIYMIIYIGTEQELLDYLSSGGSLKIRDNLNNSPLHLTVTRGDIGMSKALLQYGADVDDIGYLGRSPLHLSAASNDLLHHLLKYQPNLSLQDDEGNSILHYLLRLSAWWNNLGIRARIKSVLSAGADINVRNKSGESPLDLVVLHAIPESRLYMETILEFLDCKPDVTTLTRSGHELLSAFLHTTNLLSPEFHHPIERMGPFKWVEAGYQCLQKFFNSGANPNTLFRSRPILHHCLESGRFPQGSLSEKFLVTLLGTADVSNPGASGDYPLHIILSRSYYNASPPISHRKVVLSLIDRHVSVNQPNGSGLVPLELWLRKTRGDSQSTFRTIAVLLVKAGASSMIMTTNRETLFDETCDRYCHGSLPFFYRLLLEADIESQQSEIITTTDAEWVEVWRSAWKSTSWSVAKSCLAKLELISFRPKSRKFMSIAFIVIVEHLLKRHRAQLQLYLARTLEKDDIREDYEEYYAILKDCRERNADIDTSFYTFLLDLKDI